MLDLEPSFRKNNINNFEEVFPTMREENETLIYLPQNYFSLKHHQTLLTIPFHQAAKLFPPPSPPSQKQHTFSLKLKSIHRQSRRPFHSNILKLSFPFKPKGDSRPLRRSTPEFSCVCRLRPLPPPPPPPHHHPPSCTRRKTHERTRPSENRLAARISGCRPFSKGHTKGCGMRRCVRDLWRQTPATLLPLPPPLPPRKRNPLRLAVSRDLPVIARNLEERRGKEDRDRNNDDLLETLETFRFE